MISDLIRALSGEIDMQSFLIQICVLTFVTVCCLPVHECAHAWAADKLGDPTGRLKGRISFNPLDHLSLMGTLMLFLFGFGYAKPVPINIRNFKKRKLYFGLSALAGPISNIILAIIFVFISCVFYFIIIVTESDSTILNIADSFFFNVAYCNVVLAVFNLIPVPPLDGSRILTMILPDKIYYKVLEYERYSLYILFALIFLFNRLNISPISIISEKIFELIYNIVSFPFSLFL